MNCFNASRHIFANRNDVGHLTGRVAHRYLADHPVTGLAFFVDGLLFDTFDLSRTEGPFKLFADPSLRIPGENFKNVPADNAVSRNSFNTDLPTAVPCHDAKVSV